MEGKASSAERQFKLLRNACTGKAKVEFENYVLSLGGERVIIASVADDVWANRFASIGKELKRADFLMHRDFST